METQDQEIEVSDVIVRANKIQDKKRKHGIRSSSSSSGTKKSTDHANVRVWVSR